MLLHAPSWVFQLLQFIESFFRWIVTIQKTAAGRVRKRRASPAATSCAPQRAWAPDLSPPTAHGRHPPEQATRTQNTQHSVCGLCRGSWRVRVAGCSKQTEATSRAAGRRSLRTSHSAGRPRRGGSAPTAFGESPHHRGVVDTNVRYFGVKSTNVPLGADGTKPAKVAHCPSWPTKAAKPGLFPVTEDLFVFAPRADQCC